MTIQEDIKVHVFDILNEYMNCYKCNEATAKVWAYLHSKGVVIKVKSELLQIKIHLSGKPLKYPEDVYIRKTQECMLEDGYVKVEPLIEEVNDD